MRKYVDAMVMTIVPAMMAVPVAEFPHSPGCAGSQSMESP